MVAPWRAGIVTTKLKSIKAHFGNRPLQLLPLPLDKSLPRRRLWLPARTIKLLLFLRFMEILGHIWRGQGALNGYFGGWWTVVGAEIGLNWGHSEQSEPHSLAAHFKTGHPTRPQSILSSSSHHLANGIFYHCIAGDQQAY